MATSKQNYTINYFWYTFTFGYFEMYTVIQNEV